MTASTRPLATRHETGPVAAGGLSLVAPLDSVGFSAQLLEGQRAGTETSELPAGTGVRA